MVAQRLLSRSQAAAQTAQPHRSIRPLCAPMVARGKSPWGTALPRSDLSWLQRLIQSHVQLLGELADTSSTLIQVVSIEIAGAQERPLITCATGKFLCTACHLAVCVSTGEAGRDTARRTGAHQACQPKCRYRLLLGASCPAYDPRTDGTAVGDPTS